MRDRKTNEGLTVNAVAGSYVVVLGLNITDAMRQGLRGFAIKRTDKVERETYWMSGTKVFESIEPHPAPGGQFSSLVHPFQTFQWSDYSAKPGYSYTYTIVAMYGAPGALEQRLSMFRSRQSRSKGKSTQSTSTEVRRQRRNTLAAFRTESQAKSGQPPMSGCRAGSSRASSRSFSAPRVLGTA
jgi:hypothetical protein